MYYYYYYLRLIPIKLALKYKEIRFKAGYSLCSYNVTARRKDRQTKASNIWPLFLRLGLKTL